MSGPDLRGAREQARFAARCGHADPAPPCPHVGARPEGGSRAGSLRRSLRPCRPGSAVSACPRSAA